jgi:peptidyl-prolyl cis-trans isomerase C
MASLSKKIFLTLCFYSIFMVLSCANKTDSILANTDSGITVTSDEFKVELNFELPKYNPSTFADKKQTLDLKKRILDQLIERKIFLKEAESLNIKANDDELENEFQDSKSNYNEKTFQKMLQAKNLNYSEWKERKKFKLILNKLATESIKPHIKITEQDVENYYQQNKHEFFLPERIHAQQIVTDSEEKTNILRKRILKGEDFSVIAMQNSLSPDHEKGGDLGIFAKGIYPEVFDKICFNLGVGQISEVIKTDYGYHIFKVVEQYPAKQQTLEEIKDTLAAKLQRKMGEELFENWKKEVLAKANVQINLNLLERIPVVYEQ